MADPTVWTDVGQPTSGTSLSATNLTPGANYDFQVIATNSGGSATSATLTAATPTSAALTGPTNLAVSVVDSTSASLSWGPASGGSGAISYQPQYRVSGNTTWINSGSATTATSATVSGLTAGTTYEFDVVASNTSGSAASSVVSATLPASVVAPGAPTNLSTGAITTSSIAVSWAASTGTSPITYQAQYRVSGNATWIAFGSASSATSTTITGLSAGTNYEIRAVATNSAGSANSSILTAKTLATSNAPSAPTLTLSGITISSVTMDWTASSSGSAPITYQPQYRASGQTVWINSGSALSTLNAVVNNLNSSTTYEFQVVASNSAGTATSPVQTAATRVPTAQPGVPGTPVAWIITPTAVSITWSAAQGGTQPLTYQPQYRQTGQTTWNSYGQAIMGLGSTITGLTPSLSYDFRVVAFNPAGTAASGTLTLNPPPSGANVTAASFRPGQVLTAAALDAALDGKLDASGGTVGPLAIQQASGNGSALPTQMTLVRTAGGASDAPLVSGSYVATFKDGPLVAYSSAAMTMTIAGDANGVGPAGNMLNIKSLLEINATRSAQASSDGSQHAAVAAQVDKNLPQNGITNGQPMADGIGLLTTVADHTTFASSKGGAMIGVSAEISGNATDDADTRFGSKITYGEDTPLANTGLPFEISRGLFVGALSSSAYAKVAVEVAGSFGTAALDLRAASAFSATITSATPTSTVTTLSVSSILPFASAGLPARTISANNPKSVLINGHSYSVIGVSATAGQAGGTLTFNSPVTIADASNGNTVTPSAHSIWLSEGGAGALPGTVAFNRSGSANIAYRGSDLSITTGADRVVLAGSKSLKLPHGTSSQRSSSPEFGEVRANDDLGVYEMYVPSSGWVAFGSSGGGSGSSSGSTTSSNAPGPALSLVAGTPTTSAVPLSWSAPSTGVTPFSYQVEYAISGAASWTDWGGAQSATSSTVSNLSSGTRYDFQIITSNNSGSSTSATTSVTLASVPPAAATNLSIGSITSTTVSVSWTASASGTAPIAYQIYYRVSGGTSWTANPAGATVNTSQAIAGLTAATNYDFYVSASNNGGTISSTTATASTAAASSVAPSAPQSPTTSSPTSSTIVLSWTAPATGTTPFAYQPAYRVSGQTTWIAFGGPITATTATITGLAASTAYEFRITATNSLGSTNSATATGTTAATPSASSGSVTGNASSGNSAPIVSGPASGSVVVSNVLNVTGITISDPSAASTQGTCTLVITSSTGTLSSSVSGVQVSGSGSKRISYSNTLNACQSVAANLIYTASKTTGSDTISVSFTDQAGANGQISISISITASQTSSAASRDPSLQPFAATSFWNIGIGSGATWSASGDADTVDLTTDPGAINAGSYSMPYYKGTASDPLTTVTCTDTVFPIPPQKIRIPANATPATGGDAHMNFFDATQPQYMWSYYGCVRNSDGSITAALGAVDNVCGNQLVSSGVSNRYNFGIGTIRQWELQAGAINHMLRFSLPVNRTKSPGASWDVNIPWPNDVEDYNGPTNYTGHVIFGSTVGIPPGVNLSSLGLSSDGLVLATCLQKYGAVMRDTGGSASEGIIFYAEPTAEGSTHLTNMRNDMAKIAPVLKVMRNQASNNVNGGGTYPTPLLGLDTAVCPTNAATTTIPSDSSGTIPNQAQAVLNGFGVQTHIDYSGYQSIGLSGIENYINYLSGVKLLRDAASSSSDSTWWTQVAQATNTRFIACIPQTNASNFSATLDNIKSVSQQYIAAYEGCDEADTGQASGYSETLQDAAAFQQTVWSAGQTAGKPVIQMSFGQGFDTNPSQGNYGAVGDQSAYASYGNAHAYTPGSPTADQVLQNFVNLTPLATPGKPPTITSFGWVQTVGSGYGYVSPNTAAAYILMFIFDAFKLGCIHYIWNELIDDAASESPATARGLFTDSGTPRPTAVAIRNLFTLLTDNGSNATTFSPGRLNYSLSNMPSSDGKTGGQSLLMQKSDGSWWLALWNEQPLNDQSTGADLSVASVSITLNVTNASAITVYDPVNGTSPIQSVTNATSIGISLPARVILVKIVH